VSPSHNTPAPRRRRRKSAGSARPRRILWWIAGVSVGLFATVVLAGAVVLLTGAGSTGSHLMFGAMLMNTSTFAFKVIGIASSAEAQQ
jgi:hypothetical protein